MTAPSIAERWRLLQLTARHGRRGTAGRTVARLGWQRIGPRVEEFVFVPSDLRTPDPGVAGEWRQGRLVFAGETVNFDRQSPFNVAHASAQWLEQLHGFGWLRDLEASDGSEGLHLARRLTADWLDQCGPSHGVAWKPEVLARRIISWLSHSGFLLEGSYPDFFRGVAASLGGQLQALAATWRTARPGVPQLQCLVALLLADLAIAGRDKARARDEPLLLSEINRQVLGDGGHVSRNSDAVLDLLLDLLPLHRCYKAREIEPPPVLADAVRRMLLNLRAMRLGDGSLARFNGAGTTRAEALATVLAFDTGEGRLPAELPASGYVRLERGQTILLMDCAAPPALEFAGRAQAGCLAFEMSDGSRALLVNGGYPGTSRRDDRPAARATANHNTLTVNGQSSARFVASPAITRLCGDAALTGPAAVTFRFMAHNGAHAFEAMHDGYAETMLLMHSRRLELSQDGQRLEGRDRLGARQGVLRLGRDLPFAIHFHLAPRIRPQIEVSEGKSSVRLIVPGQPDWRLTTDDAEILIEASQRYDTAAPTPPSRQIVLRGSCPGEATVTWTLQRLPE